MAYTSYPHPTNINGHGDNTKAVFPQLDGSAIEWVDDVRTDRTMAGTAKTRSLYTSKKRSFRLVHRVSAASFADYETFYDTYRKIPFSFTWAGTGTTYTCRFAAVPRFTWNGMLVNIEAQLLQV